jgi:hypothetical protein
MATTLVPIDEARLDHLRSLLPVGQLEMVLKGLGRGNDLTNACELAGLPEREVREWISYGDRPDGPLDAVIFRKAAGREMALVEDGMVQSWMAASEKDWRAAQSFLKTRAPDRWSETASVRVQHTGNVGLAQMPDAAGVQQILEILTEAGALPKTMIIEAEEAEDGDEEDDGIETAEVVVPRITDNENEVSEPESGSIIQVDFSQEESYERNPEPPDDHEEVLEPAEELTDVRHDEEE